MRNFATEPLREYRTYEMIALEFGVNESNLIRRSHWVENTLIQHGFSISKYEAKDAVAILDATEIWIERPKKINLKFYWLWLRSGLFSYKNVRIYTEVCTIIIV